MAKPAIKHRERVRLIASGLCFGALYALLALGCAQIFIFFHVIHFARRTLIQK